MYAFDDHDDHDDHDVLQCVPQVDAKGDMEATLKSACSSFISCAVEVVASPIFAWANKVERSGSAGSFVP